ncbi:MAG: hypothetical protein B7X40_07930 [Cellulomonas sp. 14-74-6]|nr:MAG: hypothetical protein B7X40_07930 [Cellulomonas sp. 14-74-6]
MRGGRACGCRGCGGRGCGGCGCGGCGCERCRCEGCRCRDGAASGVVLPRLDHPRFLPDSAAVSVAQETRG